MSMTPKQKLFVQEYLKDKNATRAAKAAKYSDKTAYSIGEENLRKPEIRAAVDVGLAKQMKRAELSGDMVIAELRKIAFVKMNEKELKRISGHKTKALELIGKHFKLFTDVTESKVDATVSMVSPEQVKAARDKLNTEI